MGVHYVGRVKRMKVKDLFIRYFLKLGVNINAS